MLRPEPMTRTLVVAPKSAQRAAIETLYDLRSAHIVEFNERDDEAYEGFGIGEPLEEGSEASERLVRLRALKRQLDLEDHEPKERYTVDEIEERLDQALVQVETDVQSAVESRDRVESALDDLENRIDAVEPFTDLPLDFQDYRGYDNLEVFVGSLDGSAEEVLRDVSARFEAFEGREVTAVFAEDEAADEVDDALVAAGFQDVPVPDEEGSPAQALQELERERSRLEDRLETARDELEDLRRRHGDFLLAAEEHLTIEVEKAEAPLDFATSENAFVVEAWIPKSELGTVEDALTRVSEGPVHVEPAEVAEPHPEHVPGHDHEDLEDDHEAEEGHEEEPEEADTPPTRYDNPPGISAFEPFTDLFSRPRYDELDPTISLALVFPFFYGIMIGDLGYGIAMALLGVALVSKLKERGTARSLGVAFLVAGTVAALSGAFLYGEAFGIPFGAHHHAESCAALHHEGETSWQCLIADNPAEAHPFLAKLTDVTDLLVFSVLAAYVHLGAGLLMGFVNELPHDRKHAAAQIGWLAVVTGIFAQIAFMGQHLGKSGWIWSLLGPFQAVMPVQSVSFAGFPLSGWLVFGGGLGAVILGATEGAIGLIEIPSMLGNVLSYTRLAGVAVAKAAMAVAFNGLFLVDMLMGGGIMVLVGGILLIVGQLVVFALGLLSSGIQAIRLNYVEHFRWFYNGGGLTFDPFGRSRSHSTE